MNRLPVVAIVGRPNVGKSTLFNRLTRSRAAVVEGTPGVTRDRLYGEGEAFGKPYRVIDTGGLDAAFRDDITRAAMAQTQLAIDEADVVIFLIDGAEGINKIDYEIADRLQRCAQPVILVANKLESLKKSNLEAAWDLRLGEALPVSAVHGTQIGDLLERLCELLPEPEAEPAEETSDAIRVAVVGRPNVGKSSLVNAILGEERCIVSEIAGTTRDAIDTPFERDGQRYVLVDTAGVRRKAKVHEALEYYTVLRSFEALERSDVVVLCLDALDGATSQDMRIAGMAHEKGRGLILVVNKWDLLLRWVAEREASGFEVNEILDRRLYKANPRTVGREYAAALRNLMPFCVYAPIILTTAITAQGVAKVLAETALVAEHHAFRIATPDLNRTVREVLDAHPPSRHGKPLKVLYTTQARVKPPTFVFFVNDPDLVHFSFERHLEKQLRAAYNFEGTPLKLVFRARREEDGRRTPKRASRR
ncbi:MAG: ribosome biogenesis GTPase Der [Fimbriimonadaceae bacterium]|nr:ribosome biogenesis GTPase Der [Fimbriimonadaceae bacterium]